MQKTKVSIGLSNPKNPENVASVLRAAGNYGVDEVFYTGLRYPRALQRNPSIPKLQRPVSQHIPISAVDCLIETAKSHQQQIVCVEFAENAQSLPDYAHPQNALYIFGPEDGTLAQDIIDQADAVVYVPTVGCMNLAASVNVVFYDRLAKRTSRKEGNSLIRQSRDTNNTIKVK